MVRLQEQFGYAYDAAWNLNRRTNNVLVQTFGVNQLNELTSGTRSGTFTVAGTATEPLGSISGYPVGVTNVTVSGTGISSGAAIIYADGSWARTNATLANGNNTYTAVGQDTYNRTSTDSHTVNLPATIAYSYDLNGNLLSDGIRNFAYDDENELVSAWVSGSWSNSFAYDGLLRKRIERDYQWNAGTSGWVKTNEVHYVYDGNLVIQERDANNLPLVSYTRGNDMSGSLQGAGGIGGLLARTDNGQMIGGNPNAHAYYYFDANGNVVGLVNTNGYKVAQYTYDPFGNVLTMSGPLAFANTYRFSSKEWNENSGLYYYGRRFYDPNLQKWPNRDPIQEWGGINLYEFACNNPLLWGDAFGLQCTGTGGAEEDNEDVAETKESLTPVQENEIDQNTKERNEKFEPNLTPPGNQPEFRPLIPKPQPPAPAPQPQYQPSNVNVNAPPYFHYTSNPNLAGGGLRPGSGVTTVGNFSSKQAMFNLGIDPPKYVYPVTLNNPQDYLEPDTGIPARSSVPAYKVTQPTPPGSVGQPTQCPAN